MLSSGIHRLTHSAGEQIGSHRREASRVRDFQFALAVSGIRETCTNVCFREVWEFSQDITVCHSTGQVFQDVIDCDSQAANARLAASLARFYRDDVGIRHRLTLFEKRALGNQKCFYMFSWVNRP